MSNFTYTYSVANDFPDQLANISRLDEEIRRSSIITALRSINRNGDTVNIVFRAQLSAADKTTLDGNTSAPAGGLIAAHDGSPTIPVDVSADAILEAASGRVPGERTITFTGLARSIDDTQFHLIRTGPNTLPQVTAPTTLSFSSDDANESTTGALALLVEWLDENWHTNEGIFPTNGTNSVTISTSAMRLQRARIAAVGTPFGSNLGTITFQLGSIDAGTILPGDGQMHRMFHTTPANTDTRFLGYNISAHQGAQDANVEVKLCATHPVDVPAPPEACLFTFFTSSGQYDSRNIYVPSIPEKTDFCFKAKNLNTGTCEAAMTITLYERPLS